MERTELRIFSYLPNPRLYKATIAARLAGVELELRGAAPGELAGWLWDFDAHPLDAAGREAHADAARQARTGFGGTLYKTDAFLAAHPYGTVPAAFSGDGRIGVFESNSIMRAVARLAGDAAGLYGTDPVTAARIDGFLDVSLLFARDSQIYLLALTNRELTEDIHARTAEALHHWLDGIERALGHTDSYIACDTLSLADIAFACELALMHAEHARREPLEAAGLEPLTEATLAETFPRALAHFDALCAHAAFAPDLAPYLEKLHAAR
ncbi:MAG: glutathione S-transferase family protein [Gammaproteobacteria bacterium]